MRRANPGEVWQCPEVKSKRIPMEEIGLISAESLASSD